MGRCFNMIFFLTDWKIVLNQDVTSLKNVFNQGVYKMINN
jgi:hypothetical protein